MKTLVSPLNVGVRKLMQSPPAKRIKFHIRKLFLAVSGSRARRTFQESSTEPAYLDDPDLFAQLQHRYRSRIVPAQTWQASRSRRLHRPDYRQADQLLSEIGRPHPPQSFLDVGCRHAMTCYALHLKGYKATGIDIVLDGGYEEAQAAGVTVLEMDAAHLAFENETFDCAFSLNSFEHIQDPDQALAEMIRVVRPGGYIYLAFSPLYMSPLGLHGEKVIGIPYAQLLFSETFLSQYLNHENLHLNKWSCTQFRQLWQKYTDQLTILRYSELIDPFDLELVVRYSSCFRSKTEHFDDLVVAGIQAVFQKRQS